MKLFEGFKRFNNATFGAMEAIYDACHQKITTVAAIKLLRWMLERINQRITVESAADSADENLNKWELKCMSRQNDILFLMLYSFGLNKTVNDVKYMSQPILTRELPEP